jgi:EAL domain-containing protein (putative c-di-GMP-specific phosphodiesterase class I)
MSKSALGSVTELSQFIETGEFRYAAQYIKAVDGKSNGVRWFEWLLRPRFQDPTTTTSAFIQAVESVDLALDMDMRVIADALHWLDRQTSNTRLTINVSSGSFANRLFASHVTSLIEESTIIPEQLCFDITVHDAVGNLSGATRFVRAVRRLGCKVALDDGVPGNPVLGLFGPMALVDFLKIDRRWVTAAPESESHRQTLESVVDFGQRMNLKIIAEGVDNQTQLKLIRDLDVEYYQGYIDGEPQLVDIAEEEAETDLSNQLNRSA